MPDYVKHNPSSTPVAGIIVRTWNSVDPSVVAAETNTIEVTRAVFNALTKYKKVSGGAVVNMTAQEQIDFDVAEAAANLTGARNGAKNQVVGTIPLPIILRALADVIRDEINIVRGWTVSFKAEVAASTNLANLQTRVATLSTLSDKTLSQLKTAINNKIDAGTVDT